MNEKRPHPDDPVQKGLLVRSLEKITPLLFMVRVVRDQKMLTRLHRYYYSRNHRKIEIDITYRCNMKCIGCNRSCTQLPTKEQMTLGQIERFIKESIDKDSQWQSIMLIGGEPTLHPDLPEMIRMLFDYKKQHSPEAEIVLATNGSGSLVNQVLATIPAGVTMRNTEKEGLGYQHEAFNDAPQDSLLYKFADYTYGCGMAYHCGTGLTPYGYYTCPIAGGGIDRIFGLDLGRQQLPDPDDQMEEQRTALCRYCGHFKHKYRDFNNNLITPSWETAYRQAREKAPTLSYY